MPTPSHANLRDWAFFIKHLQILYIPNRTNLSSSNDRTDYFTMQKKCPGQNVSVRPGALFKSFALYPDILATERPGFRFTLETYRYNIQCSAEFRDTTTGFKKRFRPGLLS